MGQNGFSAIDFMFVSSFLTDNLFHFGVVRIDHSDHNQLSATIKWYYKLNDSLHHFMGTVVVKDQGRRLRWGIINPIFFMLS